MIESKDKDNSLPEIISNSEAHENKPLTSLNEIDTSADCIVGSIRVSEVGTAAARITENMQTLKSAVETIKSTTETASKHIGKIFTPSFPSLSFIYPTLDTFQKMPKAINMHKYDKYKRYKEEIENDNRLIEEKKAKIEEIELQLGKLSVSKNIRWSFASLIYLSFVGILLPLALMPVKIQSEIKWSVILLFISGIGFVFFYINYEFKYINNSE